MVRRHYLDLAIRGWRAISWSISGRSFRKVLSIVFLKRRRLGSVEENFIKQLQIGDLFVLGGRIVRLIDTGVQAAFVERADGHLPTVPRWNAAKMPLTSGLAEGVRKMRTDLAERLRRDREEAVDWLVENYQISIANAEAILEQFRAQLTSPNCRSVRC